MHQVAALAVENCDRVVEECSTYATKERPTLDKLLTEMKSGDTLVVWGFERLACSIPDLCEIITRLHDHGIVLRSVRDKFISTHPDARPMLKMLRQVTEFKTFIDSERSALAKSVMKEKGITNGSTRKLSDRDMRMIFALIDDKVPKTKIAKQFNVSTKTLHQTLRDPRYMGEVILRPRRNPALKERLKDPKRPKQALNAETE